MRAWLLVPIVALVALVACMDSSKDDDDDDDDDESGLDDSGVGSGDEDSGDGDSGGEDGGPYDGTYQVQLSHIIGVVGGGGGELEVPCEVATTTTVADWRLTGETECDADWIVWTVSWDAQVDADGNLAGEVTIDIPAADGPGTAPLTGEIDGDAVLATFEARDGGSFVLGEIAGERDR